MSKANKILISVLMLIAILISALLKKIGIQLIWPATLWLLLSIATFIIIKIGFSDKKILMIIPILFLLLTITDYYNSKKNQDPSQNTQDKKDSVPITSKKPVWKKRVEITGRNPQGTIFFVDEDLNGPGYYDVEYLGEIIYDTPEDRIAKLWYDIHGVGYLADWKKDFIYSHIPGVKGLEALIIVDGKIGSGDEKVYQFPDGKRKIYRIWVDKYIRIFRHEAYRMDYNDDYFCFNNNYGKWVFEITKSPVE